MNKSTNTASTTYNYSDFGQKFNKETGISQLMDDLGTANASEETIYMLGGGNPAQIPEAQQLFRDAMMDIMATPRRFERITSSYDSPQGDNVFIDKLCKYLNDSYDWKLTPKNIALTNGSQASFFALFNLFAGTSENRESHKQILLPLTPEYIGYKDIGLSDNMFTSFRPLIEDLGDDFFKYRIDIEQITDFDNIGAICTSRPTNPTGNVLTDNEVRALDALARKNNVPLIIDGAYGTPFPNIIFTDATPFWNDNIILCLSLSKLGLPGVRTGIIIANEEVIQLASKINAIYNLAVGSVGPAIASQLLDNNSFDHISNNVVKPFYKNKVNETIALIKQHFVDIPVKIHQPEGAIFLWLWFPDLPISSKALYEKLKLQGVYVIAGEHFFPGLNDDDWQHQYECIRLSYAGDTQTVDTALQIIAKTVGEIYQNQ